MAQLFIRIILATMFCSIAGIGFAVKASHPTTQYLASDFTEVAYNIN